MRLDDAAASARQTDSRHPNARHASARQKAAHAALHSSLPCGGKHEGAGHPCANGPRGQTRADQPASLASEPVRNLHVGAKSAAPGARGPCEASPGHKTRLWFTPCSPSRFHAFAPHGQVMNRRSAPRHLLRVQNLLCPPSRAGFARSAPDCRASHFRLPHFHTP